ncbi:MAG: Xaa-Pro peptidase family protein [Aggregatilineales bacterium]
MEIITQAQWHTELASRRAAAWQIAEQHECDLLLVFGSEGHSEPFRYLTNFVPVIGDGWGILRGADAMACVLNFDWQLTEARRISGVDDWYGQFDPTPVLIDLLAQNSPQKIGVVGLNRLPFTLYESIRSALSPVEFVDIGQSVAILRRRKTPLEIQLLREAGRITDHAFEAIRAELRPGLSEQEVAAKLDYLMQRMGAGLSFPTTVVSGNDDPIMIRMPTDRRLQKGDSIMIDMGAMVQGYQADASRTFVLGESSPMQTKVWSIVKDAYDAALAQIRPGVPCNATHQAAIKVIEGAGYELIHRVGHGIGLATSFEWPSLISETTPFEAGMTVCIEPGIYVKGAGNMKLEDDVVVTDNGVELLTKSSHEIQIEW